MKFEKNSKIVYIILAVFYTTFVAVVASSVTTNMFLSKYFDSEKFDNEHVQIMYAKYLEEMQIKNREKAFQRAKDKNAELEMYRQSVINRLNLIDSIDRKIYLLRDMQAELEHERDNVNND